MNDSQIELGIKTLAHVFYTQKHGAEEANRFHQVSLIQLMISEGLFSDLYVVAKELKFQKAQFLVPHFKLIDHINATKVEELL